MIIVRIAVASDMPWIMAQLRHFSAFFGTKTDLFDSSELEDIRTRVEFIATNHVFLIAEKGGEPIGLIAGMFSPHPFNPKINVLGEIFFWVEEAHRGGRSALLLMNEFTRIGKTSANWITFSRLTHSPINERCLTRRGYRAQETSYLLEVS